MDRSLSGSKSQSDPGRVKIAGFRRVTFIIILAPIIFVFAVGTYLVIRDVISGFPDRRPVLLSMKLVSPAFLCLGCHWYFGEHIHSWSSHSRSPCALH